MDTDIPDNFSALCEELFDMMDQIEEPVNIFCLYAPEDEVWVKKLERQLSPLQNRGEIAIYPGSGVKAGQKKCDIMRQYIERAHLILFFVSPDFFASDDCKDRGVPLAMQKYEREKSPIIPVVLRPTMWQDEAFFQFQALPANNKPVVSWGNEDEALFEIARGIQDAVRDIQHNIQTDVKIITDIRSDKDKIYVMARNKKDIINIIKNQSVDERYIIKEENNIIERKEEYGYLLTIQDAIGLWPNVIENLKVQNIVLAAHVEYCRLLRVDDVSARPIFVLQAKRRASYEYLQETSHIMDLTSTLTSVFHCDCRVSVQI